MTWVINKWPLKKYYSYNKKLSNTGPDCSHRLLNLLPPLMIMKLQKYSNDKSSTNSRKRMTDLETLSTRKKHLINPPMIIIPIPQEFSLNLLQLIMKNLIKFREGWLLSIKNFKVLFIMAHIKISPRRHSKKLLSLHSSCKSNLKIQQ